MNDNLPNEAEQTLGKIRTIMEFPGYSDARRLREVRKVLNLWTDTGSQAGYEERGSAWERHDDPEVDQ